MVRLNPWLLDSATGPLEPAVDLNACLNAHGLYNSIQFVLRLSPEVHRKIAALPNGIVSGGFDFEGLQAFSTYLHENVHWWQHIGSITGLMLSLSYPGQAHANYTHLKNLVARIGAKKSILRVAETGSGPGGPGTDVGLANTIVNNHFDIEFFRILVTNPGLARKVGGHPLFDCVGHSYQIAYGNIVLILATTVDPELKVLPDPRGWTEEFRELRSQNRKGYHHGSDVNVVPIGAHEIFEGQARFAQLQYLHFGTGGKLEWDDFRSLGMLKGVYGVAFEQFLRLAELDWPPSVNHPVVALFMLICDIAINPGTGFPMPLQTFPTFIEDVDPGFRFLFLCRTIAKKRPDLAQAIKEYSRDEYEEVSTALAAPLMIDPPLAIAENTSGWVRRSQSFRSLMEEYRSFEYGPINLPVRLLFSHFLAFSEDKLRRPEFFCWPGAWMAGDRVSDEIVGLFERQSAPFIDKAEDGGIYPRLMTGRSETTVHESFETFYAMNVTYDMTRQWIAYPGPFRYDYRWLSSSATDADQKAFADRHFEMVYGVHADNIEIV